MGGGILLSNSDVDHHSLSMAAANPLVFRWGIISTGNIATSFVKVYLSFYIFEMTTFSTKVL